MIKPVGQNVGETQLHMARHHHAERGGGDDGEEAAGHEKGDMDTRSAADHSRLFHLRVVFLRDAVQRSEDAVAYHTGAFVVFEKCFA